MCVYIAIIATILNVMLWHVDSTRSVNSVNSFIEFKFKFSLFYEFKFNIFIFACSS